MRCVENNLRIDCPLLTARNDLPSDMGKRLRTGGLLVIKLHNIPAPGTADHASVLDLLAHLVAATLTTRSGRHPARRGRHHLIGHARGLVMRGER